MHFIFSYPTAIAPGISYQKQVAVFNRFQYGTVLQILVINLTQRQITCLNVNQNAADMLSSESLLPE